MIGCGKMGIGKSGISDRKIHPSVSTRAVTKASDEVALAKLKEPSANGGGFMMDIIAESDYIDHASAEHDKTAGKFGDTRTVIWSSGWTISPEAFWINDTPMSFWAYNKVACDKCDISTPDAGTASISFTYPKSDVDPDGQDDLLFAYSHKTHESDHEHDSGDSYDEVSIEFIHAMSKIAFDPATTLPSGFTISEIRLKNLFTKGDGTFDKNSITWEDDSFEGKSDFGIDFTGVSIDSKWFLVIPQNAYEQSGIIELTLEQTATGDLFKLDRSLADHKMLPGKAYVIKMTINTPDAMTFTVSEQDWDIVDGGEINPNA